MLALAFLGNLLYRQIQQLLVAERELKAIRKELEVIAHTDGLTSLANRRNFDLAMDKEWKRATRNQTSISVILLDIDLFKQYNDHYGHLSGDDCLVRVANLIAANVNRPGDIAARYGGEEFVVLLPDTELAGAVVVAENIRLSLLCAKIQHSASPFGIVTISSGVVSTAKTGEENQKEFLIKADRLLYSAKAQGRNRVGS